MNQKKLYKRGNSRCPTKIILPSDPEKAELEIIEKFKQFGNIKIWFNKKEFVKFRYNNDIGKFEYVEEYNGLNYYDIDIDHKSDYDYKIYLNKFPNYGTYKNSDYIIGLIHQYNKFEIRTIPDKYTGKF